MAATVRDWQLHGVTLKVELATSGSLVVGGNQTDFPFDTGGEYGAPSNWDAGEYYGGNAGNESLYNWTTSAGIFSVSAKTTPVNARSAGIWQMPVLQFPMEQGYKYQVGVQARQMAGKATSVRSVTLERSANGAAFTYYTGSQQTPALTDWEGILATGTQPVSGAGWVGRVYLTGGPPSQQLVMWGVQFQNLFVTRVNLEPEPTVWTDVTCDVKSIGIRYGRERFTNRYDVATMQLDLLNTHGAYSFHQPHPLGLQPGRQVRVTATYKGVTYPMAFHILDTINDAYDMDGMVVSRWSCVDPTSILGDVAVRTNTAVIPRGGGERVKLLLDQVGYVPRLLDSNNLWMQPITGSGRTIRDECGLTADSEGGQFFADRQGNCVYKNRDWLNTDINLDQVTADLVAYPAGDAVPVVDQVPTMDGAPLVAVRELNTDWSKARLINFVSLAIAGGNAQEFVDEDSYKTYGPATYTRHDFVLYNYTDLPTRAADIMTGYTEPVLRVNTVSFAPGQSPEAWPWSLSVFLNWMVRVWYTHPLNYWGYAFAVHIQSIEHRITPTDWEISMSVDLPESFTELEWLFVNGWDHSNWDEILWDQGDEPMGSLWNTGATWSNPTSKWGI